MSLVANYLSHLIHTVLAEQRYPVICSDLDTTRLFSPEVIRYKLWISCFLLCRCSTTSESTYKQMAHIVSFLIGFYSLHSDFLHVVSPCHPKDDITAVCYSQNLQLRVKTQWRTAPRPLAITVWQRLPWSACRQVNCLLVRLLNENETTSSQLNTTRLLTTKKISQKVKEGTNAGPLCSAEVTVEV